MPLTREEALKTFGDFLTIECPEESCKAPEGKLCDTHGVWIHFARMIHVLPDPHPNDGCEYYLEHSNAVKTDGIILYGPFPGSEIDDRYEDDYADILADCGDLKVVRLTEQEANNYQRHSREYWIGQLALVTEFGK